MLYRCVRAILFWLALFELLAERRGWRGLTWLGRAFPRPALALGALGALAGGRGGGRMRAVGLALAAPPALAIQAAASSLRRRELNPLLRLRPGEYADRVITRLDIPLDPGSLPALWIAPRGGAHAAVAVLHGSGCDKTFYAWPLADALIARRMGVLLVDLDGHGENPRPQSYPAILADARAAVGWLRGRCARVGLIGISLGGCIAARAVADGLAVDALAVFEAPPLLSYTQADVRREALALAQPRLMDIFADCTVYNLIRAWNSAPIRATVSTWDLIAALDLAGSLPQIAAPLMLIYGGADAIVKPAQAEQARRAAPPGATFRLIPGASHLTLTLTPAALALTARWLAERLRP